MTERFTPEQIEQHARGEFTGDADGWAEHAAMLRQAARDRRTIERLRAWLKDSNHAGRFWFDGHADEVLAQLDALEAADATGEDGER